MKKIAALIVAAGATVASAQSLSLSAVNSTDAGRGLNNAEAGDVISFTLTGNGENSASNLFGAFFNIATTDALGNFGYPNPAVSALFSTGLGNIGEIAPGVVGDTLAGADIGIQANFGSDLGADPAQLLTFDMVYNGGTQEVTAIGGAANYADFSFDLFENSNTVVVTPAPASAALLGLGGLVAARRRRA